MNKSVSKEKLLDGVDSTTVSSENLVENVEILEDFDNEEQESKRIILNKFLSHQSAISHDETETSVGYIKPPVPKPRKNRGNPQRRDSQTSKGTYDVTAPTILKNVKSDSSLASNATYNVQSRKEEEEICDVSHNSATTSKNETYRVSCKSSTNDSIKFTNEIKPKPRKKLKNKTFEEATGYNYENILEIIIHKTDRLLLDSYVTHPVVKVHIVDVKTGEYHRKSDPTRPVVFYHENDDTGYVLPVMSSFYDLQEKRSLFPMWEEVIIFNDDFRSLINENIIIFFELLDFASSSCNFDILQKNSDKGWFKIAFAFLRPVVNNTPLNTDKKVRLQLYYPGESKTDNKKCYVWHWWHGRKLKKYPSTIYVTVKKASVPRKAIETFRSKTPLQKEGGDGATKHDLEKNTCQTDDGCKIIETLKVKRSSKSKSKCRVPDKLVGKLDGHRDGCFLIKFSHDGLFLAGAVMTDDTNYVVVYAVETLEETTRFTNHYGLIYSINWSKDDKLLITASADNTVAIWDYEKRLFLQILPHPSFVYASVVDCDNDIVTGCYDKTIRVWRCTGDAIKYTLDQELENRHDGYVTTLCINKSSDLLYSGDSAGCLNEWQKQNDEWWFKSDLLIVELRDTIINQIVLFKNEKKMLVHARDSTMRIISLTNSCVLLWLQGALNTRVQTFCSISFCGSYVSCGSENGLIAVWDAKSGKTIRTYRPYHNSTATIHCVQFHPKENLFAVARYSKHSPILLYGCSADGDWSSDENGTPVDGVVVDGRRLAPLVLRGSARKYDFKEVLQKMDEVMMKSGN